MKRSEIAMIILVASLSMLLTFSLAQSLLGDKIKRKVSVEQTQAISDSITQPTKRTFNSEAINPTVEVCVESSQADRPQETAGGECVTSSDTPVETDETQNTTTAPEQQSSQTNN